MAGRASSKDWKRSIRYAGRPLQCLIHVRLSLLPPFCWQGQKQRFDLVENQWCGRNFSRWFSNIIIQILLVLEKGLRFLQDEVQPRAGSHKLGSEL